MHTNNLFSGTDVSHRVTRNARSRRLAKRLDSHIKVMGAGLGVDVLGSTDTPLNTARMKQG